MLFSSCVFLFAFLPVVLLCYYGPLRATRRGQNLFLLIASLFFYAFGEPRFVLVMMGSILVNWLLGLWAGRRRAAGRSSRVAVVCAVALNLALLFVFKYLTFVLTSLNQLGARLVIPGISLPIGISFFTFQALSYVIDVHRGKVEVQRSLLSLGLYISFFPQLIAGPIVKYAAVADQLKNRRESWSLFSSGVCRFLTGLGKKVLLSNALAVVADAAFAAGDGLTTALAWLGSLCYTLQIYYDFSGYSDMAIGLGRMFGFQLPENFDHPYAAASITEFWRRWHISLSSWFRDYVYIPLGGNRVSKGRHTFNLLAVWVLTGVWHGAGWTFLLWGLFYFALLWGEKRLGWTLGWPVLLRRFYTLLAVNFAWVLFRSDGLAQAAVYLAAMLGRAPGGLAGGAALYLCQYAPELLLGLLLAVPSARWLGKKLYAIGPARPVWDLCYVLGLTAVSLCSAALLVKGSYNPFIYFNF
jgi:alginate O-acetyltransferase complex protein AlgI